MNSKIVGLWPPGDGLFRSVHRAPGYAQKYVKNRIQQM